MEFPGLAGIVAALFLCLVAPSGVLRADASPSTDSQPATEGPKQLKSLSLEQLGNIEVTTFGKQPTGLWTTPAALYIISSDDIIRSGATNIADALRLAPGVEVGRLSSTTWAVGIRGLENNFSKSVLVLIDGRNVYTPLFAGVYWDVQDMPLEDIDRIEVIRGPGGTIWGPNAANGVINIITKQAADTKGILADALVGTEDHTIDDLQIGSSSRALSYRVFGRGFERGHEYHSSGIAEDSWHQERLGLRADLTSGRNAYFLEGDLYQGTSPHVVGTTLANDQTSGGDINARWQRTGDDGSGISLQGYFDRTLRTGSALGETRDTIDIDFIQRLHLGSTQRLSYGAGLRWSPYQIIAKNPGETLIPPSAIDHEHTGFLEDQLQIGKQVFLTAGAKLQHNNDSGFDIQPSGRLLWLVRDHQSVWLGLTRAVTTPSDIEEHFLLQGAVGPATIIQVLGNRRFKSEDLLGYEVGYRQLINNRVYVDLDGFWSRYTHLQSFSAPIVSASGGNTYITIEYENQITGSIGGFEISPQFEVARWWQLDTSYSFLNPNFHANGPTSNISSTGSVQTYDQSSPKHSVVLQSKFDLPSRFQFDQLYRYVSDLRAQKVPAYQTMDLRLERPLGRNVSFEVVGQNLFQDHHYEWGTGDPTQPPVGIYRAAYVQLSFRSKAQPPN